MNGTESTHSNKVDPNYKIVFNQSEVLEFNITIDSTDWQAMQDDLQENPSSGKTEKAGGDRQARPDRQAGEVGHAVQPDEVFTEENMTETYSDYYEMIKDYAYDERSGYSYIQSDESFDSAVESLTSHGAERNTAVQSYLTKCSTLIPSICIRPFDQ